VPGGVAGALYRDARRQRELALALCEAEATIRSLERSLRDRDGQAPGLGARLDDMCEALGSFTAELRDWAQGAGALADRLLERESDVAERERLLDVREAQTAALARYLTLQLEDARRASESLAAAVAARDAASADLEARLEAAERTAEALTAQHDRFAASLAGRLLKHYGRIKHRYLLPVYQLARKGRSEADRSTSA
jgi:chromosome segregation ATPase